MRCLACERGDHLACEPIADVEVEMRFHDCDCLHDDVAVLRGEHVRVLLAEAEVARAAGNDLACAEMLRRALALLAPPVRKPPAIRHLYVLSKPSSADRYAAASGEPIEPWMRSKR